MSRRVLLLLCCLISLTAACNTTIAPTATLSTALSAAMTAHSSSGLLTVCLQAGAYSGCGEDSLISGGGGPVVLAGAGVLTVITCESGVGLVNISVSGSALANMTVVGTGEKTTDGGAVTVGSGVTTWLGGVVFEQTRVDSASSARGGAVFADTGSSLTLNKVAFVGCAAAQGGGLFSLGSVTATGCSFTSTTATATGAALHVNATGGQVDLTDCSFYQTVADAGNIVAANLAALNVRGATFDGTVVGSSYDGGIALARGAPGVDLNCNFEDIVVRNASRMGTGALHVYDGASVSVASMTATVPVDPTTTLVLVVMTGGGVCELTDVTITSPDSDIRGYVSELVSAYDVRATNLNVLNVHASGDSLISAASLTLTDSALTNCSANSEVVSAFDVNVMRSSFARNAVTCLSIADGTIGNSSFADNIGTYYGAVDGVSMTVWGSTFERNVAEYGGAVQAQFASVFSNCSFSNNVAVGDGGAVYVQNSRRGGTDVYMAIHDSEFVDNVAADGAAFYGGYAHLTLSGSSFVSNTASATAVLFCVALASDDNIFLDNTAATDGIVRVFPASPSTYYARNTVFDSNGGAPCVYVSDSSIVMEFDGCVFRGNAGTSVETPSSGPGLVFRNCTFTDSSVSPTISVPSSPTGVTIVDCEFSYNKRDFIINNAGSITVTRTAFISGDNCAAGAQISGSPTAFTNCSTTGYGHAAWVLAGSAMTIDSCYFAYNDDFSVQYTPNSGARSLTVTNSVFYRNNDDCLTIPGSGLGSIAIEHTSFVDNADVLVSASNIGLFTFRSNNVSSNAIPSGLALSDVDNIAVEDSSFSDNTVVSSLVAVTQATTTDPVSLRRLAFTDNIGSGSGTAIHIDGVESYALVADSTFERNSGSLGGAVYFESQFVVVIGTCAFVDNSASSGGGAVVGVNGAYVVVDATEMAVFSGNVAPSGSGGAFYFGSLSSGFVVAAVVNGSSASSGGAAFCGSSACTFDRFTVTGSVATADGGGLACSDAVACHVTESSFTGCGAFSGGAIASSDGTLTDVANSSFVGNVAAMGGALNIAGTTTVSVTRTTFGENYGRAGGAVSHAGPASAAVFSEVVFDSNTAVAAGAALLCLSSAESVLEAVDVVDCAGPAALYALFLGDLSVRASELSGNGDVVAGYGARNVSLERVTVANNRGSAFTCAASPLYLDEVVVRNNNGDATPGSSDVAAIELSDARGVVIRNSFVSANAGAGLSCSAPKAGYGISIERSGLCDNAGGDGWCHSDCVISGLPGGCPVPGAVVGNGSLTCAEYCDSSPNFCVADNGVFTGPYGGCHSCDGPCYADDYTCAPLAECVDAPGYAYNCSCSAGYAGNGHVACADVDECTSGTHDCSADATCTNTVGSFTCECNVGFAGNGRLCSDVDECSTVNGSSCVPGSTCTNTHGSHACACTAGYYGNGLVECLPCPENTDSPAGSANVSACECVTGFYNIQNEVGAPCEVCRPGMYLLFLSEVVCLECPPDSYSTEANTAGACTACPPATSTLGATGATAEGNCSCAVGLELVNDGGNSSHCERFCGPGTYRTSLVSPCFECPVGTYSNDSNADGCTPCPIDSTTTGPGASSVDNCTCYPGYFAPSGDAAAGGCERYCPPGSRRPSPNALDCVLCDAGTYSDVANMAACAECPVNAVSPPNSTDLEDCGCPPGYYTPARKAGTECLGCPQGAKCKGGVSWPIARRGYAIVEGDDGTAQFAECVPYEACSGNGQCSDGYVGELCERCDANYYRLDGECYPCKAGAGAIVFVCCLILFAFCAALVWFNSQDRVINKFASLVIGINALQIAAMYGRLNLHWPPLAEQFFAILSFANFNIELLSPECAVTVTDPFVLRWLLTILFPLFVGLMFVAIYGIGCAIMYLDPAARWPGGAEVACVSFVYASKWTPRYLRHTCVRAFYQLMTIGYLPLSAAVFEFFDCVKDANGVRVIATARQTVCYTTTYWALFPFALVGLFLYPIGIPAFCAGLLKWKPARLGMVKFLIRYGFLVGRYRSDLYGFELAVMLRKVLVAFIMSFLSNNAYVKAGGAIATLTTFYTIQLRVGPYRKDLYNRMEEGCLLCSILVLLVSVVFQADGTNVPTRDACLVLILVGLLVIIAVGLCLDARAVFSDEKDAGAAAADNRAEVYDESRGDHEDDYAAAAVDVGQFVTGPSVVAQRAVERDYTSGELSDPPSTEDDEWEAGRGGRRGERHTSNPLWMSSGGGGVETASAVFVDSDALSMSMLSSSADGGDDHYTAADSGVMSLSESAAAGWTPNPARPALPPRRGTLTRGGGRGGRGRVPDGQWQAVDSSLATEIPPPPPSQTASLPLPPPPPVASSDLPPPPSILAVGGTSAAGSFDSSMATEVPPPPLSALATPPRPAKPARPPRRA